MEGTNAQRHKAIGRSPFFYLCASVPLCLCAFVPFLNAGTAILWIPRDNTAMEDVVSRIESDPALRVTAALGEIPAELAGRISVLSSQGRLETAARPPGDPVIPLLYYPGEDSVRWSDKLSSSSYTNDPFFLSLRMSDARDAYVKKFQRQPHAFVSPPGGLVPAYIPLARALGFNWAAAGTPAVSSSPFKVIDADGVKLVLFSTFSAESPAPDAGEFIVFDETLPGNGTAAREAFMRRLSRPGPTSFMTVSEALSAAVSTGASAEQAVRMTAPWSGDYTPWTGASGQAGALSAFARTRGELMKYFNSKQGDYKAAEPAITEYFSVESGAKLLRLADPDPEAAHETEIEIQNSIANSYRLMDKMLPGWLFSEFSDLKGASDSEDKVEVRRGASGFVLVNVARSPSPPEAAAGGTQDQYKLWKLSEVSVSWTADETVVRFSPMEAAEERTGGLLPEVRFDLYIDVNNRPRAGNTLLLDGHRGRLFPDDAWEYALTASPESASLYAATGKGPKLLRTLPSVPSEGALTVSIPRDALRGNPELWGYAAFMLYAGGDGTLHETDFLTEDLSNGYYYAVRPAK